MSDNYMIPTEPLSFNYAEATGKPIIKVIGVGGGGGNAVTKMYEQRDIQGVSYLLCNTDQQVLDASSIPAENKICLGPNVTKGLGAGNNPSRAREAALDSEAEIRRALTSDETKMVFITAGMGGGTGTGAAPVIGRIAKETGKLTIGIVTTPFVYEGRNKIVQALRGVQELKQHVDAILVVNNQRLIEVFPKMKMSQGLNKSDETLMNAARSISDMVNHVGRMNIDFNDVEATLKDGGVAIIATGVGRGPNRVKEALNNALTSPLVNHNNFRDAHKLLCCIYTQAGEHEIAMEEQLPLQEFTSSFKYDFDNIPGLIYIDDLEEDEVRVTILASGFDLQRTKASILGQVPDSLDEIELDKGRQEEDELINNYYGPIKIGRDRHAQPLVLELDELDNTEILDIAESIPALRRDLAPIEAIRKRSKVSKQSINTLTEGRGEEEMLPPSDRHASRDEGSASIEPPQDDDPPSSNAIYF